MYKRKSRKNYDKSYVYFMQRQCDGLIKIGTTINLPARASGLRTEHGRMRVLGVIDGWPKQEREIHEMFSDLRMIGYKSPTRQFYHELFRPMPRLLDFIEKHCRWTDECTEADRLLNREYARVYMSKLRMKGIIRTLEMSVCSYEEMSAAYDYSVNFVKQIANDEVLKNRYRAY